ncbi:hypothetical protein KW805_04365 [Candidatus Pacearchaeota archaeon]|nr:hypothetical protein [Candidatus Pacearchaeota archaeon]
MKRSIVITILVIMLILIALFKYYFTSPTQVRQSYVKTLIESQEKYPALNNHSFTARSSISREDMDALLENGGAINVNGKELSYYRNSFSFKKHFYCEGKNPAKIVQVWSGGGYSTEYNIIDCSEYYFILVRFHDLFDAYYYSLNGPFLPTESTAVLLEKSKDYRDCVFRVRNETNSSDTHVCDARLY